MTNERGDPTAEEDNVDVSLTHPIRNGCTDENAAKEEIELQERITERTRRIGRELSSLLMVSRHIQDVDDRTSSIQAILRRVREDG